MNNTFKIDVDSGTIINGIIGMQVLCDGVYQMYSDSLDGVLHKRTADNELWNAYDHTVTTYKLVQGAITTISTLLEIIGDSLINEDIVLRPGVK